VLYEIEGLKDNDGEGGRSWGEMASRKDQKENGQRESVCGGERVSVVVRSYKNGQREMM